MFRAALKMFSSLSFSDLKLASFLSNYLKFLLKYVSCWKWLLDSYDLVLVALFKALLTSTGVVEILTWKGKNRRVA